MSNEALKPPPFQPPSALPVVAPSCPASFGRSVQGVLRLALLKLAKSETGSSAENVLYALERTTMGLTPKQAYAVHRKNFVDYDRLLLREGRYFPVPSVVIAALPPERSGRVFTSTLEELEAEAQKAMEAVAGLRALRRWRVPLLHERGLGSTQRDEVRRGWASLDAVNTPVLAMVACTTLFLLGSGRLTWGMAPSLRAVRPTFGPDLKLAKGWPS